MGYAADVKAVETEGHGGPDVLRVRDTAEPSVAEGSILIEVRSAGVNRADLLQRRGHYPPPPGAPETLGLECAGVLLDPGFATDRFAVGNRVMALLPGGGQAERAAAHPGSVIAVPELFADPEAGGFPEVFLTAFLNLFVLGGLDAGMTALIHGGSGGVGTAAIQLARASSARIIVTAGSAERCRRCLELGADAAVDYHVDDFSALARDFTGGRGVDVVLDCVGGAYLERNLEALGADGRLVVIGLMGGHTAELDLRRLLSQRIQLIGSTLRALPPDRKGEIVSAFVRRFGDDLAAGRLRPVIDSVYPLARVADAHRRLESGEAFGKVVLTVE
jgi:putative PIG3 family NAD(P)H quinone oxidoreductase